MIYNQNANDSLIVYDEPESLEASVIVDLDFNEAEEDDWSDYQDNAYDLLSDDNLFKTNGASSLS